ncbi:cache domain-containing protein [Paenibacillus polymyxa]|uniref:cache domain-containing protein n=1 Tax=Paenibacillus polymyxa TaxID=1406 RepID=UPI002025464D|nr:cache domain-containing protein [Paenibacillus polymyxa]WDZ54960.1 cache domain-containing protein [Paenibacillus polymyxa]
MRFQREILFHYRSHFSFITMLALPISFLVLLWMAYGSYMDGERTVIEQQQQQLLTIAKLNSTSIESFFDEQMHTMQILAGNRQMSLAIANMNEAMIDENLSAYYTAKKDSIYRISQVSPEGRVVHTFPKRNRADAIKAYELIKDDIQRVLREKKAVHRKCQAGEARQLYCASVSACLSRWEISRCAHQCGKSKRCI